jgi:catechol 2,3-dioxygenase-like lactoylglutathione lyase family enzyme
MGAQLTTLGFDHVGLSVADLDAQSRFYEKAFGFVEIYRNDLHEGKIRSAILRSNAGAQLELIERAGSKPQYFTDPVDGAGIQGYFHWALKVDDLDTAFESITSAGAASVTTPANAAHPGIRFAYVRDPEGNLIELIQEVLVEV